MIATITRTPRNPRMMRTIFSIVVLTSCVLKSAKLVGNSIDGAAYAREARKNMESVVNFKVLFIRIFVRLLIIIIGASDLARALAHVRGGFPSNRWQPPLASFYILGL